MTPPFKPEPLEALQRRYPQALAEWVDVESVELGVCAAPASLPLHRFCFEDGLLLVVSRDKGVRGQRFTHVSASCESNSPVSEALRLVAQAAGPNAQAAVMESFATCALEHYTR